MIVETRKTAAGIEYWDTEGKRTLFVPAGEEPAFEVTEEPTSMIGGVDLASGPDYTVVDGFNIDGMNVEQMLAFAEQNNIDVPGNIKKVETIQKYIVDKLAADAE